MVNYLYNNMLQFFTILAHFMLCGQCKNKIILEVDYDILSKKTSRFFQSAGQII